MHAEKAPDSKTPFAFFEQSGASVRFHPQASLVLVPAELCSRFILLMLDTGAEETALYDLERTRESRECLVKRPGRRIVSFLEGKIRGREVLWPNMRIRGLSWPSQQAIVLAGKYQEAASGHGILSPLDLGIHRLSFDFVQGVISFVK